MKKIRFLILFFVGCMVHTHAQVGINTTNPFATLDVVKEPSGTVADGIIAPNLSLTELIARNALYGANQSGSFVYITAIDATPAGKTRNVTTVGYYYFDGTEWKHFNDKLQNADNGLSIGTTANVQLGGDLVKNTTIDTKTNTLTITKTGGTDTGLRLPIGASSGHVLTSDGSGNATWNAPGFSSFSRLPGFQSAAPTPFTSTQFYYTGYHFTLQEKGTYFISFSMPLTITTSTATTFTGIGRSAIIMRSTNTPTDYTNNAIRFLGSYEQAGTVLDVPYENRTNISLMFNVNQIITVNNDNQNIYTTMGGFSSNFSGFKWFVYPCCRRNRLSN